MERYSGEEEIVCERKEKREREKKKGERRRVVREGREG